MRDDEVANLIKFKRVSEEDLQRQRDLCIENKALWGRGKQFYISTFGCQLNENDSEKVGGLLTEMGLTKTDDIQKADIILINTCSIRENAAGRFYGNLGELKSMKRNNPNLIVGVCGCMMKQEIYVERVKRSYRFVDIMFGPSDIWRLPEILNRRLRGSRRVYDISNDELIAEDQPILRERKYRALVSIMFGCNNFCTFCVVPHTRGRERSRNMDDIVHEVEDLVKEGYSEVMLLGQNVDSYGKEIREYRKAYPNAFAELVKRCAQTGIKRLRFMTSHPKDISLELLDVMQAYPNVERHLHLPLQSGSDKVLKAMNRHYNIERYMMIVDEARKRIPDLKFSTDIIVGFPGEEEADFEQTLAIMEKVRYATSYTFQYSPRPNTPAALEEQIPQEIVDERFQRLVNMQNEHSLEIAQAQVGRICEVLIEGVSDHVDDRYTGRSSDNFLINFSVPDSIWPGRLINQPASFKGDYLEGKFCKVRITEAKTFSLTGEYVSGLELESDDELDHSSLNIAEA